MKVSQFSSIQYGDVVLYKKSMGIALTLDTYQVFSFDLDGRFLSFSNKGLFYQRSLGDLLLLKSRTREGLYRESLSAQKKEKLYQSWFQIFSNIQSELSKINNTSNEALDLLKLVCNYTPLQLKKSGKEFTKIYKPVSILPPDQYTSIVLQLTEGCSYNRCHFCDFYKNRPFKIKTSEEFESHTIAVKDFIATGLAYRKQIFLADGDALMVPQKRLMTCLSILRKHFPERPIFSFMDAFRPQAKTKENYVELKNAGLKRVYFGIETGDPALLEFIGKPGSPEIMAQEIHKLKAAGLSVGLIFMVGIGGKQFQENHFNKSFSMTNSLPLDHSDIIFLSEFVNHPGQPYFNHAQSQGIESFMPQELPVENKRWIKRFRTLKAQVSPYRLQEFIY